MNGQNRQDGTPLYERVVHGIRQLIEEKGLEPGDRIPNETELCRLFDVSRITVRKGVSLLSADGILEKRQGKGTYVGIPGVITGTAGISGFYESCRKKGMRASAQVIHVKMVKASELDALELGIGKNGEVLETLRIRLADNVPVMLEKNHFSRAYSYLLDCDLEGSLYNLLRGYGAEPGSAEHEISMRVPDSETASMLSVPEGFPLIFLREVIYDQKGRPLHNSEQWIRGDIFTFRV